MDSVTKVPVPKYNKIEPSRQKVPDISKMATMNSGNINHADKIPRRFTTPGEKYLKPLTGYFEPGNECKNKKDKNIFRECQRNIDTSSTKYSSMNNEKHYRKQMPKSSNTPYIYKKYKEDEIFHEESSVNDLYDERIHYRQNANSPKENINPNYMQPMKQKGENIEMRNEGLNKTAIQTDISFLYKELSEERKRNNDLYEEIIQINRLHEQELKKLKCFKNIPDKPNKIYANKTTQTDISLKEFCKMNDHIKHCKAFPSNKLTYSTFPSKDNSKKQYQTEPQDHSKLFKYKANCIKAYPSNFDNLSNESESDSEDIDRQDQPTIRSNNNSKKDCHVELLDFPKLTLEEAKCIKAFPSNFIENLSSSDSDDEDSDRSDSNEESTDHYNTRSNSQSPNSVAVHNVMAHHQQAIPAPQYNQAQYQQVIPAAQYNQANYQQVIYAAQQNQNIGITAKDSMLCHMQNQVEKYDIKNPAELFKAASNPNEQNQYPQHMIQYYNQPINPNYGPYMGANYRPPIFRGQNLQRFPPNYHENQIRPLAMNQYQAYYAQRFRHP